MQMQTKPLRVFHAQSLTYHSKLNQKVGQCGKKAVSNEEGTSVLLYITSCRIVVSVMYVCMLVVMFIKKGMRK